MSDHDKALLFDSSDESLEDSTDIVINYDNTYAQKYNDWRRKEELQKLKDKYGDNLDVMSEIDYSDSDSLIDVDEESDDESSSESVEDPFDDDFFKVYSALKNKDSKIYDQSFNFFNKDSVPDKQKKKSTVKEKIAEQSKMTLQDYHRKLIEEKKGITEEDEMMINKDLEDNSKKPASYYEDLYNIRKEIKDIVNEESDDDNLFSVKNQPVNSAPKNNKRKQEAKEKFVSQTWNENAIQDEGEKFLKDYILNQKYLEVNSSRIKFNDIDNHFGGFNNEQDVSNEEIVDEEKQNSKVEMDFANYHFEEPDANTIKRYPRTITSIRDTKKNAIKAKRAEQREAKKKEKETELRNLRKLKREEIENRIQKLKDVSNNEHLNINDLDLNVIVDDDTDFDSIKYDEKMRLLFNDNYYLDKNDAQKPQFDYIPEIDDNLYDDEEANEYPDDNVEPESETNSKKRNKKDLKKMDILSNDNIGIFEDLIGGEIATRFRYRIVEPNDFGLTDQEIMMADDKELNKWCSLKKMSQFRSKEQEVYDKNVYSKKASNLELKKKIFKSIYGDHEEENGTNESNTEGQQAKKKRGKKRRKKNKNQSNANSESQQAKVDQNGNKDGKNKRRKRKPKSNQTKQVETSSVSLQRLKAYGISNRKIKKMKMIKAKD